MKKRPECYLFDADGTLCDVSWRDPYDASRCDEDPPNLPVVVTARALASAGFGIVVTSGRKERDRGRTHAWLIWQAHLEYLALFLRGDHDQRPDEVVKEEMYRTQIAPRFDVVAIFDDRPAVVAMWRRIGLSCFQVEAK